MQQLHQQKSYCTLLMSATAPPLTLPYHIDVEASVVQGITGVYHLLPDFLRGGLPVTHE